MAHYAQSKTILHPVYFTISFQYSRHHIENNLHIFKFTLFNFFSDCSDIGLSVALGYITHILKMCSTFLQVPLRYPLTHYGSMSFITDNVSPLLPDTERDFPLYTKGKDKAQFTYAVYLLNKNIAQLRWLCYMNTNDLRATLANLLSFLQGQRDLRPESLLPANNKLTLAAEQKVADIKVSQASTPNLSINEKYVSLHSFGSNSNISDPILDCIRKENQLRRSSSPTRKSSRKAASKPCRNSECGKGLRDTGSTTSVSTNDSITNMIKITNGREIASRTHSQAAKGYFESIEQGTDVLDIGITSTKSRSIKINSDTQLRKMAAEDSFDIKQTKRISRSVGSYTDDEYSLVLRTSFELGSEPLLNITSVAKEEEQRNEIYVRNLQDGQQEFLEQWIESAPNLIYSMENLYGDEFLGSSSGQIVSENSPLMARTDALINTKSFNLVKPKP
ncbi:hypothetical protein NQ317_019143 [Molorchus minor]|uniref:Uncharacterized protein n=1 Tax=Molorchus minor TaxID=1323400 RepID=A0ABQ9JPN7_9CUCU|nr:hypothetical protein NQ317_019143 [Molorchus minor]